VQEPRPPGKTGKRSDLIHRSLQRYSSEAACLIKEVATGRRGQE
jgi:hypothetical protein